MKKSAKIPRILRINAVKDWQVFVVFNNGAQRVIDFAAFFRPLKTVKRRSAGFSKATFTLSEDFNAPLEDFNEYR